MLRCRAAPQLLSRRRAQLRLAPVELLEAAFEDLLDLLLAAVLTGLPRPRRVAARRGRRSNRHFAGRGGPHRWRLSPVSGALSISTVPRTAAALVATLVPRGPRRASTHSRLSPGHADNCRYARAFE